MDKPQLKWKWKRMKRERAIIIFPYVILYSFGDFVWKPQYFTIIVNQLSPSMFQVEPESSSILAVQPSVSFTNIDDPGKKNTITKAMFILSCQNQKAMSDCCNYNNHLTKDWFRNAVQCCKSFYNVGNFKYMYADHLSFISLTDSVVVRYLAVSSRVLRYMSTETDEGKETLK